MLVMDKVVALIALALAKKASAYAVLRVGELVYICRYKCYIMMSSNKQSLINDFLDLLVSAL